MKTDVDIWKQGLENFGEANPFQMMRRMEREMGRLFDDFFTSPQRSGQAFGAMGFAPACDIEETGSHFLLSFDLPGVNKGDLNVEVVGNQLRISGERKQENKEERKGRSFSEREYGRFDRTFTLPSDVDAEKLEANYQDGVLRIAIPKSEEQKPRKIDIGEAKPGWISRFMGKGEEKKPEGEKKSKAA